MRRTRASAPALAAIGLLLALLASILTAGVASAAVPPAEGGTAIDVGRGSVTVTGSVTPGTVARYVINGRPGSQFSMELLDLNAGACHTFLPLDVSVSTRSGSVVAVNDIRDCAAYGPWTFPADGVLIVQLQSAIDQAFQLRFGLVDFEDVATRLRSGSARLTGSITVALDGVDYVLRADPGQQIMIQTANSFCDFSTPWIKVLGSAEQELPLPFPGNCTTAGTWTVPADGVVKVRVGHRSGQPSPFPDQGGYDFTVNVFRYPTVKLPAGRDTVEVKETVTVPMGGAEYVVTDASEVDALVVEVLAPTQNGTCAEDVNQVELNVELIVDGTPTGRQPLVCGPSFAAARTWTRSLVVRITGFSPSGIRPSTGKYRVALHPLHTAHIPVNVTAGPATVSGSIDVGGDVTEYVITGPPGRILVAHDPDRLLPQGTCLFPGLSLTVSSNDAPFDPSLRKQSSTCGRFGPYRIPASGVIHVQVSSQGGPFPPAGAYRLTFDTFDYETVPVDITAGPQEVSGHLDIPLDGINYVVTGQPGDQVRFEVLSLDAPGGCDTTRVFALEVDVYNADWFDLSGHDVGYNGCGLYLPNATLGPDGQLVFRAYLGGTGDVTSGGYTIRFSQAG